VKESHRGDRTLDQMRPARPVSHGTDVSCQSRDRRVRSSPKETAKHARSIGQGGASGHDRPDASGRAWVLTGLKPDAGCNASGQL
jgi:hypothetical protein